MKNWGRTMELVDRGGGETGGGNARHHNFRASPSTTTTTTSTATVWPAITRGGHSIFQE